MERHLRHATYLHIPALSTRWNCDIKSQHDIVEDRKFGYIIYNIYYIDYTYIHIYIFIYITWKHGVSAGFVFLLWNISAILCCGLYLYGFNLSDFIRKWPFMVALWGGKKRRCWQKQTPRQDLWFVLAVGTGYRTVKCESEDRKSVV